ncbi:MAG: hypothetical protein SX243_04865 [Acidobacteriota bacterium]|nr:hypothetical protein [Acidobacteriota bacterium]
MSRIRLFAYLPLIPFLIAAGEGPPTTAPPLDEDGWAVGFERALDTDLQKSEDIRWASAEEVFLAVPGQGVVRVSFLGDELSWEQETTDGHGVDEIVATEHLAASEEYLVSAAKLFSFGWKRRGEPSLEQVYSLFESLEDIDVQVDRYAILGLRRGLERVLAPDGMIAWVGRMGTQSFSEPVPVHGSMAGPGALPMSRCMAFGVGAVRFLGDGSLIVVPGAESGAYHYSASGRLLATWDTEALGVGVDCSFDMEKDLQLARNLAARRSYLNRFRTAEEILVLDGVPNLVVRRVEKAGTRWELIALEPWGKTSRRPLPVESTSKLAHLRGDVRDGQVVLLIFDEAAFLPPSDPLHAAAQPSRLIVLEPAESAREAEGRAPVGGAHR